MKSPNHKSMTDDLFEMYDHSTYTNQEKQDSENEAIFSSKLCNASQWSIEFRPDQPIVYTEQQIREMAKEDADLIKSSQLLAMEGLDLIQQGSNENIFFNFFNKNSDIFTTSLIIIISTLSIVAFICIAIGCILK